MIDVGSSCKNGSGCGMGETGSIHEPLKAAQMWYRKAAAQGDLTAILGIIDISQDDDEMSRWAKRYSEFAASDKRHGYDALAIRYEENNIIDKAKKYYRKAMEIGLSKERINYLKDKGMI